MNLKLIKLQSFLIGLFSLILAAEWAYGVHAEKQLQEKLQYSQDGNSAAAQLPVIAEQAAAGEYNELVERPLFIEGRKPIAETVAENVQPVETGQIDDWLLIGVYNKDKRAIALFSKKNEAKKYLKIGNEQMISGWMLKEIKPDRVLLQQADQQKSVLLRKPRPESAAPIPGKPAAQPPAKPVRPARPPVQPNNINPENANDESQQN